MRKRRQSREGFYFCELRDRGGGNTIFVSRRGSVFCCSIQRFCHHLTDISYVTSARAKAFRGVILQQYFWGREGVTRTRAQ